jgi:hypothetical protein
MNAPRRHKEDKVGPAGKRLLAAQPAALAAEREDSEEPEDSAAVVLLVGPAGQADLVVASEAPRLDQAALEPVASGAQDLALAEAAEEAADLAARVASLSLLAAVLPEARHPADVAKIWLLSRSRPVAGR